MGTVCEMLLIAVVLIQPETQADPSQDLFCFRFHKNSAVNCTWNPSDVTPTNYTFYFQEKGSNDPTEISTRLHSLMLERKQFTAGRTYVAWVKTSGTEREESLKRLEFIIDDIVKPLSPAAVTGELTPNTSKSIFITWQKPNNLDSSKTLQFKLQYRVVGDLFWTEISKEEIGIHSTTYELEDLQPFTLYEIRVQCAREGETNRRLWSDWSAVSSIQTSEGTPVGSLDLWFTHQPDLDGLQTLTLLWKHLEQHQARGIIQKYSVVYRKMTTEEAISSTACCSLNLPRTTQWVNVTAHNSVGATQPAILNLTAGFPPPFNMTVHSRNRSVQVFWEPPANATPEEFVVEWYKIPVNSENTLNWKKIPAANVCVTLVEGLLYPLLLYRISVYARYQAGLGGPVSTLVYAEEGVPLAGPEISILNISQTGVTLLWKDLPLDQQRGFIKYLTLYYVKNPGGLANQKTRNLSYTLDRYTLLHLEPDSTYTIWMTASTIGGEGRRGPYLHFKTQGSQVVTWMLVALFSTFVVTAVISFCFCRFYKQRIQSCSSFYLPQWCCQKIPDPRNSNVGHEQYDYPPSYREVPAEPVIEELEEIETDIKAEVPFTTSNNSTLAEDIRPSSSEDSYWMSCHSAPPEASTCLEKKLVQEPETSTTLMVKPLTSTGYEKHFLPSEADVLNNEWQLADRKVWMGTEDDH
ncbi:interleukin-12 receptor subunit beta-2-like [Chiloscyllium punctatum]|uniref:interleukin-12 receptor subunit beta-2-like n=1 Tax=Chiloscyllium punctatum TaxID=137246 RepID=UPI003B6407BA